jgi:hypothetical protein
VLKNTSDAFKGTIRTNGIEAHFLCLRRPTQARKLMERMKEKGKGRSSATPIFEPLELGRYRAHLNDHLMHSGTISILFAAGSMAQTSRRSRSAICVLL